MKSAIAFATIFLGLTLGPHEVEVLVSQDVASVEIVFGGRTLARLDGRPWKAICDLGPQLAPRSLEAIAFDSAGEEIGRAVQWLNTPRPPAQGRILLETDPETGSVIARLRSTSITQENPSQVVVQFDGKILPTSDPNLIVLPKHDPEQLHYLRVDFEFDKGLSSTVERTFGGGFADEVKSDLTAVPLQLEGRAVKPRSLPTGWLQARGEDLSVVDVVQGPVEIVLVRDQSAQRDIDYMTRRAPRGLGGGSLKGVGSLKKGYSLTVLRPYAERLERSDADLRLFRPTARLTAFDGGVFWLTAVVRAPIAPMKLQRLSDALAVAGLTVATDGHRRAVVLLLGEEQADNSQYTPQVVRAYLEQMRVPLFIWSTDGAGETPWGTAEDASSITKFERRTKELVKSLERQRIAWVRGVYLPPEITLAEGQTGIRLAGS